MLKELISTGCLGIAFLIGNSSVMADISFQDRTVAAGLTTHLFGGYGSSWVDFNQDGLPDIWINNHMYQQHFYINNGNGTFTERLSEFWTGDPLLDKHGSAWADFDNDGDPDLAELYGVVGGTQIRDKPFYVNQSNFLTNESELRGMNDTVGRGRTPLWLDWNNDGLLDLYMANYPRTDGIAAPSNLMLQQSNGSFAPVPELSQEISNFFAQLAYFDSAVHLLITSPGAAIYPKKLYRLGNTTSLPIPRLPGISFIGLSDVAIADFDGDFVDDMFILRLQANKSAWLTSSDHKKIQVDVHDLTATTTGKLNFWLTGPKKLNLRLFIFASDWTPAMLHVGSSGSTLATYAFDNYDGRKWKHINLVLDAANPIVNGMVPDSLRTAPGIYVGRLANGQWRIDIRGPEEFRAEFVANDTPFTAWSSDGGALWNQNVSNVPVILNRRNGAFEVKNMGFSEAVACGSIAVGDFDNDMDMDAYLACGAGIRNTANILLENKGGKFVRVSSIGSAATQNLGTGGRVSVADYDNDGYLDLLVTDGGRHDYPFDLGRRYLLRNRGGSNHWLKINLVGCQSNRDGIGARVIVEAGERKQARLQGGGIHDGVQDDRRLHFGLAENEAAESVTVNWPSGLQTKHSNLAAGRIHTLQENPNCLRP